MSFMASQFFCKSFEGRGIRYKTENLRKTLKQKFAINDAV